MILLLHYQNLSANNVAFAITVEILPVIIKTILSKMRASIVQAGINIKFKIVTGYESL
jgi:hypothetical protein